MDAKLRTSVPQGRFVAPGSAVGTGKRPRTKVRGFGLVVSGLVGCLLVLSVLPGCVRPPARLAIAPPPDPPPIPARKPLERARVAALSAGLAQTGQSQIQRPVAGALVAVSAPAPSPAPALDTGVEQVSSVPLPAPQFAAANLPYAYVVQRGDTVYGIARKLGVPLREVMDANALTPPYTLSVSQTLRIPNPRRHTVKRGDTVYGISRAYSVDMSELVRLNGIAPPYTISPGGTLVLPAAPETAVAQGNVPGGAEDALGDPPRKLDPPAETAPREVQKAAVTPARLTAIPKPPPRTSGKFLWPVNGRVLAGYGPKEGGLHNDGINIAAPRGAPVMAAENGVVAYIGNELRGFGNLILVKHADGWVTAYAHADEILVSRGQQVQRGQKIASVGSTGNVSTPQLHFEIRRGSRAVDPRRHLAPERAAIEAPPPA